MLFSAKATPFDISPLLSTTKKTIRKDNKSLITAKLNGNDMCPQTRRSSYNTTLCVIVFSITDVLDCDRM